MKVALTSALLVASASAFTPQVNQCRASVAMSAESRREAMAKFGAAAAAFGVPAIANAAAGESPRFSVFGVIGDGTAYSEGAAYGSDQSGKVYSPYSVYGEASEASLYKEANPEYADNKKKILAESQKRLSKLDKYIQRKEWFNVTTELDRYMGETRAAVRVLAKTPAQKTTATNFFKAIEATNLNARLKKQDACAAAAADSIRLLDSFVASL